MFRINDTMIYTIRAEATIRDWFHHPDPIEFDENIAWRTGYKLLESSTSEEAVLPIVFGDAGDTSTELLAVGIVRDLEVDDAKTICKIGLVRPLRSGYRKSDLELVSSAQTMSMDDIRPYRICRTPQFIIEALGGQRIASPK
jgi:hypothetical protein